MPLLVSAVVRVGDCEDECSKSSYGDCGDLTCLGCYDSDHGSDDRRGESLLLKGLSQVTELELSVESTVFIVNRDLKLCPTFRKLKTLFLSEWCPGVYADCNVLTCILQHSPILEKLTLQLPKVPKIRVETERSYTQLEQSFICNHLIIVDIKCEEADWRVQETLEILSTYGSARAPVLRHPVIPARAVHWRRSRQGGTKETASTWHASAAASILLAAAEGETKLSVASGADRISALPDEVLHHVMSFLPMHEVVPTSLLARRWLDLWKSVPSMSVTGVKDCYSPKWFIQYVDNLLLLHHPGARLDSFRVDLDECDFSFKEFLPTNDTSVGVWFRLALLLKARVLSFRTTYGIYSENYEMPLQLPNAPIISQHLKILDLEMVTLKSSSLDLSGCPVLVDLKMNDCEIYGNLSSPFLKHLSLTECFFGTGSFRACIYTPGLISLVLSDFCRRTPMLENMPLLVSAIVRINTFCEDQCCKSSYGDCGDVTCSGCYDSDFGADDRRGGSLLLNGLSQVTELELSVDSTLFIVNRDLKLCPMFCKLKTLFLSDWCPGVYADCNVLTCILQHSPNLEKLTLQLPKVPKIRVDTERSCKRLEQSFICNHLLTVDIKCEEADGRLQKTLEILSTYGIALKRVNIEQTNKASGP
ncbi:hypothetical protein U9M48_004462 [Paspalum notatum var. saurae]|uniref:F-box domain-containing protein n=1 Tax=Paspalum notatum var. saurae TaxID=547442 RepID=A0AAQ3SKS5_PASNO